MTLVKFNNNKGANALMPGFNDVFESILNDTFFNESTATRVPAVNISETAARYHLELAAPGMRKQDFKISLEHNILLIAARQESEAHNDGKRYNKREFTCNSFTRSFKLPEFADHNFIEASYVDRILNIDIAKKEEAKMTRRQIGIK